MCKTVASGELPSNTGSSAGCSVTTWRGETGMKQGGRFKRKGTYVYLCLIRVVWQKPTRHCKTMIFQLKNKLEKRALAKAAWSLRVKAMAGTGGLVLPP